MKTKRPLTKKEEEVLEIFSYFMGGYLSPISRKMMLNALRKSYRWKKKKLTSSREP